MKRLSIAACAALVACTGSTPGGGAGGGGPGGDTGPAADDKGSVAEGAFDQAVLSPPFAHHNAIWAGVALLDADGDGWTDLFFTNGENHPSALYLNEGDGSFTEVTEEAGLVAYTQDGSVVSGDLDNDGDDDLVVAQECTTGSLGPTGTYIDDGAIRVHLNDGSGSFSSAALELGAGVEGEPAAFCTISLSLADVDLDGVLDLVVSNGFDPDLVAPWILVKTERTARNQVFFGDGDGGFTELAESWDEGDEGGLKYFSTFGIAVFDLDGDGQPELIEGQGGEPVSIRHLDPEAMALVRREEDAFTVGSGVGLWMGMALADLDGDGVLDLYGTNQGLSPLAVGYDNTADLDIAEHHEVNISHAVLEWGGEGGFVPAEGWTLTADQVLAGDMVETMPAGVEGLDSVEDLQRYPWGWGAVPVDVDADGWVDVAWNGNACLAPMSICHEEGSGAGPGALLRNDGARGFEDITWSWGVANLDEEGRYQDGRGLAVGDLNRDGYPDLVFANRSHNPTQSDPLAQIDGVPQVWLSRPRDGGWLAVELVGTESNRDAAGSLVTVHGSERSQVYPYGEGGQTNSSSERLLLVGLGDEGEVDITVRFPSGIERTELGVLAGQHLIIEEGT